MTEPHTLTDMEVVKNATPGPWHVDHKAPGGGNVQSLRGPVADCAAFGNTHDEVMRDYANATFISRFNPLYVKQMLEENVRLREALEGVATYLDDLGNNLLRNDADMLLDECEGPKDVAEDLLAALSTEKPS